MRRYTIFCHENICIGTIVAQLPKLHRGEHFENLGMITSLLSKKPVNELRSVGASPRIETVPPSGEAGTDELGGGGSRNGEGGSGDGEGEGESEEESDEFDWQVEQELPKNQDSVRMVSGYSGTHL